MHASLSGTLFFKLLLPLFNSPVNTNMTDKERVVYLIEKSFSATLTEAEKADFDNWLMTGENREEYLTLITDRMLDAETIVPYNDVYWQPVLEKVLNADRSLPAASQPYHTRRIGYKTWMSVAATLLVVAAGILYFFSQTRLKTGDGRLNMANIAPGHTGALLTLANGTVLELDSLPNGVVATDNGSAIMLRNGQLAYGKANSVNTATAYNTISTPMGRQFQLSLPDGTKVWLNSGSSLRYPLDFSGAERRVFVTGEAYFDVSARAGMPFVVDANGRGEIQVLGTEFNINAYSNEPLVAATLVNGAVRFNMGNQQLLLKPGQQALYAETRGIKLNDRPDIAQVTAWKNGVFNFDNLPLDQVMRQLARWYNIEVEYAGAVPDIEFFGEMGKNLNLLQVLQVLEKSGVKFKINQNSKLVVMP